MTNQRKEDDAAFEKWLDELGIRLGLPMSAGFKVAARAAFAVGRAAERAEIVAMVEVIAETFEPEGICRAVCNGVLQRLTSEETDAK